MAGPKAPQMQISYLVAICLDCGSHTFGHALVGVHVEQNGPRTAHEAVSPNSDNDRSNQTHHWIHPCPAQQAPKQKADDDQQRHCRVRQNVNDRGPHIVIAISRTVCVLMLGKFDGAGFVEL
jgi:hypothetical protein